MASRGLKNERFAMMKKKLGLAKLQRFYPGHGSPSGGAAVTGLGSQEPTTFFAFFMAGRSHWPSSGVLPNRPAMRAMVSVLRC